MELPGRDDVLHRDRRGQASHHSQLTQQDGRGRLAVGSAACADPLDALPLRRRATLVRLRRFGERCALRSAGRQALRRRAPVCVSTLLSTRLPGAARRTDGPRAGSCGPGKVRSGWPRKKDRHRSQGTSESIQPSHAGRCAAAVEGRRRSVKTARSGSACQDRRTKPTTDPWVSVASVSYRWYPRPGASVLGTRTPHRRP